MDKVSRSVIRGRGNPCGCPKGAYCPNAGWFREGGHKGGHKGRPYERPSAVILSEAKNLSSFRSSARNCRDSSLRSE